MIVREDRSILYGFKPQLATQARFEKLGSGAGYLWGFGMGFVEYVVPARSDRRRVSQIIVRAHIQPVLPIEVTGAALARVQAHVEVCLGRGSRIQHDMILPAAGKLPVTWNVGGPSNPQPIRLRERERRVGWHACRC